MKKEIEKLKKQIEKLKNDNNAMWELHQKASKDLKSNQKSNNTTAELQGEVHKLNKSIIEHKNKEVKYTQLNEVLTSQIDTYKECVEYYAKLSSWPLLTDEERSYPIIERSDEEIINDRIRGGKRARKCLVDIEKITKE
jgi:predicted alpha/beta-fold hydrolase